MLFARDEKVTRMTPPFSVGRAQVDARAATTVTASARRACVRPRVRDDARRGDDDDDDDDDDDHELSDSGRDRPRDGADDSEASARAWTRNHRGVDANAR